MILDFHYHYPNIDGFIEKLLNEMDQSGVEYTLLMGGPGEAFWEYMNCSFAPNEKVAEAVKQHPDRILGNVYLDPRQPDAIDTLQRYMEKGFRSVKMFPPVGFMPDDEQYFPLYEKIEEAGVPILFHAGITNIKIISSQPGQRKATNSKYSHPLNFDMISRLFPKMPIVLAHMGYPHYIEARSIAHANQNVYLDISGSGPWTEGIAITFNSLGGHQFIPMDFNRVIWGSDNCLTQSEHIARSDVYLRQMGASSADRKQVFGNTAQKLLGLTG